MNNYPQIPIDIQSIPLLICQGLLIGLICSAPCGPVGILCIKRVLQKGFKYGIITGLGAALSDIIYALIAGYGMSFVTDFINNKDNQLVMQLSGSALLVIFGLYMLLSRPKKHEVKISNDLGYLNNFLTAFLLTFSNPLILLVFIALFARFSFIMPDHPVNMAIGFTAIVVGAMIWWVFISFVINKIRNNFSEKYIRILNITIGIVVIVVAIVGFVFTIAGLKWGIQW